MRSAASAVPIASAAALRISKSGCRVRCSSLNRRLTAAASGLGRGVLMGSTREGPGPLSRDRCDIDALLDQRTPRWGEETGGRSGHRYDGETDAHDHALTGNATGPSCDAHRLSQAVETIDREDDVRCLG